MNMCSLIAFATFRRIFFLFFIFFGFIFLCVCIFVGSLYGGIEPSTGSSPETDALKYQKACGAA